MVENDHRYTYCPNSPMVYCENPFPPCPECEYAWTCEDVEMISHEAFTSMDTNNDGSINLGDNLEFDHLDALIAECDYNNNGMIEECEMYDCTIAYENHCL
jgi:hypothetical protein